MTLKLVKGGNRKATKKANLPKKKPQPPKEYGEGKLGIRVVSENTLLIVLEDEQRGAVGYEVDKEQAMVIAKRIFDLCYVEGLSPIKYEPTETIENEP